MEDPGVVANTHLQAYLVLPTKDNNRKKETAVHVIFGEEKKIGSEFQLFSCTTAPLPQLTGKLQQLCFFLLSINC
jgi:hypothetical protein